ncbi:TonB-dependent receptor [Emcibacter sp. SYSU 3D8]|uniref:TonB-dependent receptor n=1 Tax=Emcibacter sp. SYSU 3D8 TaxID=3133969 RepID=UPI0031FEFBB4
MSAAPAHAQIEQVVVQARGEQQEVRDIPVAITAIGEEKIERFALKSLEDVAAVAPQLTIVRGGSGSGASISIRGIQSNSTSIGIEQSVAVILDGVYYPQGRVIDEGLFDVSQVAVLKGPQALYFGKNATAGVLAITTNDPGNEFEAMARVGYEIEQQRLVAESTISVPLTDKFGIRLALRGTKMWGGYIENNAGPTNYVTTDAATFQQTVHPNGAPTENKFPAEESFYARLTMKGTPSDRFTYTIKGSFADYRISTTQGTELFACPTLNGQPHASVADPDNPGFNKPIPNTEAECVPDWRGAQNPIPPDIAATDPLLNWFGSQLGEEYRSYGVTGKFDMDFDPIDLSAILNFHRQRTNWVGDFDGGGATSTFAGEHNTFKNFSTEVRAVTKFDFPLNAVLGVYYQDTQRYFTQDVIFAGADNSAVTDPTRQYVAYDKISETAGETISVYGELIWDITDQLQLTGGVRYLHETKDSYFIQPYVNPFFTGIFYQGYTLEADQSFNDASPEATLRWEPTDDLTLYAAYKEGFKSGGFSNSAIHSTITIVNNDPSTSLPDFVFAPEHVKGFEGGIKASLFDRTLSVELEAYHYKFKDLQIDFFNSPTFAFITENAGGAKTDGAELQFTWVPEQVTGLTLTGSLAYNIAKYTDFVAPCYAGQKPSQGCNLPISAGEVPKQQLAGQTRALAPRWAGSFGIDYEAPIGNGLLIGLSSNVKWKSKHRLGGFNNPYDEQKGYATFDAAIRFGNENRNWEFAVIGKNLTNKYALLSAGDTPGTGGNTGTERGFVADRYGTPIVRRTVELQFTWRY